ncbi:hypothetical protein AVEN_13916-1 [Araneus ventricosus]|uniref:Uncharacterized protein n=1 Tax=Araneus ventricosus TaxID=182803 RepID=A0A4Y2HWG8_ARAVE|nr:hypothetical protein AVEN_13916-1 [Araneus ventricosus]
MSLCTLEKSKVSRGLETRSCWESPRHARIGSGVACSAVHFGQISKHLELTEKVELLICPLRKRVRVVWSRQLQSIDRQPPGREP